MRSTHRVTLRAARFAAITAGIAFAVSLAVTSSALAQPYNLSGYYAPFDDCDITNPLMANASPGDATGCINAVTTAGTFKIHKSTVPITTPVVTQFGIYSFNDQNGNQDFVTIPPVGGPSFSAAPATVPGGLTGIVTPKGLPQPLYGIVKSALETGPLGVTAQPQLAGTIQSSIFTTTVPLKIKLNNFLLGKNCYIGSDANPIVLNLQLGLGTDGALEFGTIEGPYTAAILQVLNGTLSDTTFTVPRATGCGPGGLLDGVVNGKIGLPSGSGLNAANFTGATVNFLDDFSATQQAELESIVANQPPVTFGGLSGGSLRALPGVR